MPSICCVPNCWRYHRNKKNLHTFGFPSDNDLRQKWLAALPRKDFKPTKHSRVCELHFEKSQIISTSSACDVRSGQIVIINLTYPRLAQGAMPTIFSNYSDNTREGVVVKRENDSGDVIMKDEVDIELDEKPVCYDTYEDFLEKIDSLRLPDPWNKIINSEKVTIFKMEESPGPTISYSIVIDKKLTVDTFLYGRKVSVSVKTVWNPNTQTPFTSNNLRDIENLLAEIDVHLAREQDKTFSNEANSDIINHILNIIRSVNFEANEGQNIDRNKILAFIREQLQLLISTKEKYKYSKNTLITASIFQSISTPAYEFLRSANVVILPDLISIRTISSSLLTCPTFEEKEISLDCARKAFKPSAENDKHVILLLDEIQVNPSLGSKLKSVFVFTLSSVKSNLKEVIHVSPVSVIDYEIIFVLIKTVIIKLESIGFEVFCVISDNNEAKSKAMCRFASSNKLSIVYPHPVDKNRPLFYLFDTVDLLNRIKSNWLNAELNHTLIYPHFKSGQPRIADFMSLKKLFALKNDTKLKNGNPLSLKTLCPTNLDSDNIDLTLEVFKEKTIQALLEFGEQIEYAKDTAKFIRIILTWWKIVNVKVPCKNLDDGYQEPIRSCKIENEQKIAYLEKMLHWLTIWKSGIFSSRLSWETHTALSHTTHALLEITKYCFLELDLEYILLGKFQVGNLQHGFEKYRQLVIDQLRTSIRHMQGPKKRLCIKTLLTLNSKTYGDIIVKSFYGTWTGDEPLEHEFENSFNPNIDITEQEINNTKWDLPVITYLGGYCCYIILEHLQCTSCTGNLVFPKQMIVTDYHYNLINNLGRRNLLYPKEFAVQTVWFSYVLFNKIISKFEEEFLFVRNKRNFLINFTIQYISKNGYLHNLGECSTHSKETITKLILQSTVDTLLKNYSSKSKDQ